MTDFLIQAAGTVRGVLDDLTGLPVTASRAGHTADILDRLAAELAEAASLLREAAADTPLPSRRAERAVNFGTICGVPFCNRRRSCP